MSALSRRKTKHGDGTSRAPLARRFTTRYVIALVVFVAVVIAGQLSVRQSAQRVDDNSRFLNASAGQLARVYRVADLAEELDTAFGQERAKITSSELQQEVTALSTWQAGMLNGDSTPSIELPKPTPNAAVDAVNADGYDQALKNLASNGLDLVKTVNSGVTTKPPQQSATLESIAANKAKALEGLRQIMKIYDEELQQAVSDEKTTTQVMLGVFAAVALTVGYGIFRPMARNISLETGQLEQAEQEHRLNNERQTFRNSLKETLESADTEEEVLATLGRAVRAVVPDLKAEILLVNSTESRLVRGDDISDHGAPNCPVDSPMGCAAFRRSQTEVYESSRMLNACPKLAAHTEGACSAVCVPLKFRGRALGVLHTTAPDAHPPSHTQIERLTTIASETGVQLGTVRATQSDRLQATTDGLTGLLNRRSLETAAKGLMAETRAFSVAMADLDHFKDLNDTYGHEAGDTALKLFAKVMKANLRPEDVAARYGGEEFILLLPGTNIREAQAALERLQASLAAEIEKAKSVPFTASWGLTDHSAGSGFDEMVSVADAALYSAKRAGRNCIYVDGEAASAYQELAPEQIWTGDSVSHTGPATAPTASVAPVAPQPVRRP